MSHYFKNDKSLKEDLKDLSFDLDDISIKLITDSGVFARKHIDFGTTLLLKNTNNLNPKVIIDMGCGYGIIGIYLAKKYPQAKVLMYDINLKAVELSNKNIALNNLSNAESYVSDIFEANKTKADLILTNPPIRAGKQVVFEIYKEAMNNLSEGGILLVVIQKKQGAESSLKYLKELYRNVEVVDRDSGYFIIKSTNSGKVTN